ncbi:flavin-containing amine oxidoreductase-domain containing protein [Lipomyces arxii]|uniref:flavin-containing amine oxidoreductase-domain containing protein n=1 Tax=Lipomyces arxii TaxID=56418 RepID=UPI0034CEAADA
MAQNGRTYSGGPSTTGPSTELYQPRYNGGANIDISKAPQQGPQQMPYSNYSAYYEQDYFGENGYQPGIQNAQQTGSSQQGNERSQQQNHQIDVLAGVALRLDAGTHDELPNASSYGNQASKLPDTSDHIWAQFLESEHDSSSTWDSAQVSNDVLNQQQQSLQPGQQITLPYQYHSSGSNSSSSAYPQPLLQYQNNIYHSQYGQPQLSRQQSQTLYPPTQVDSQPDTLTPAYSLNQNQSQQRPAYFQQQQYGQPYSRQQNQSPASGGQSNHALNLTMYQNRNQQQPNLLDQEQTNSLLNGSMARSNIAQMGRSRSQTGFAQPINSTQASSVAQVQIKRSNSSTSSAGYDSSPQIGQAQWKRPRTISDAPTPSPNIGAATARMGYSSNGQPQQTQRLAVTSDSAKTYSDVKLPVLTGQNRDTLLATMLAESDYIDPPMTRSEYIASLGDMTETVTAVPYNRLDYYARSSIPGDMAPENYAKEGIEAAIASRLPPFALHPLEYALLKHDINHLHVTSYINIRNGVLRLWRMNHHVSVTRPEAAGCARDARFFGLAEAAFEFLVRNGYINFGVIDVPRSRNNFPYTLTLSEVRRPRLRIVVIGAGISGLGCARQLDGLFKQYDDFFSGYDATPEIAVIEGRRRIGGRVYSASLTKTDGKQRKVDLGGQIITGFGNGNPMSVIVRKQLGLQCHELQDAGPLCDAVVGGPVTPALDRRAEGLFNDMLDRVSVYRTPGVAPHVVEGDESLIVIGKDPTGDGGRTIARMEANSVHLPPIAGSDVSPQTFGRQNPSKAVKISLGAKLEELGYAVSRSSPETESLAKPVPSEAPTLGATLDEQLNVVRKLTDLTVQDLRLLNWHYANLEYANATSVRNLSLGSWDQDDGNEFSGKHTMVENGGYMQVARALYLYPTSLDVRFQSAVRDITYNASKDESQKKFTITLSTGELILADRVVCTVPLGVLKSGNIKFRPDLPAEKVQSISNLGFGVLNKVLLVYDTCFFDMDRDIIGIAQNSNTDDPLKQESYQDTRGRFYMFWNCTKVVGKPCLVALMAGNAAFDTSRYRDDALVQDATFVLSRIYPTKQIPHPVETIITKWHMDPFSQGSYSYVGPNATGADYDALAKPEYDSNLFFAGEATSRTHPATVHGAYLSGLRAAEEIFRSIVGNITLASPLVQPKPRQNGPAQTETVRFPPPPKSAYVGDKPPVPQPVVLQKPLPKQEEVDDDADYYMAPLPIKKRGKPGPKPKPKVPPAPAPPPVPTQSDSAPPSQQPPTSSANSTTEISTNSLITAAQEGKLQSNAPLTKQSDIVQ